MDGFTLCKNIKSNPETKDIPVILLTSLSEPKDVIKGLECGADNFLTKPYKNDYLISRIECVLMNMALRKQRSPEIGIEIYFSGQKYLICSERIQILDLLLSSYENAIQKNKDLITLNNQLEFEINERKKIEKKHLQSLENLEQFAYIVSHDLKEPLYLINCYIDLLNEEMEKLSDRSPEISEYLSRIRETASYTDKLIKDILEYSCIEQNVKMDDIINMNELISEIQKNLERQIINASAKIFFNDLPFVTGNITLISQLFTNLLSNAIKFRKKEGECIIEIEGNILTDNMVLFSIKDNGIGIGKEYFEKIFEVFQRLNPSEEYEGTGIGLSICKKIVGKHGGKIWLESEEGKGTTFYFTLPKA